MSFANVLRRLRNPMPAACKDGCTVNRNDLSELLRDWERLDEAYRKLHHEAEILAETTMQQEQMLQNLGAFK